MLDPETCLKDFLDDLFAEYKAKRIEYCLLRNYESLPERLDSADIDILISSSARKKNREIIKNISVNHNALICSLYVDERFDQITLFRRISSKHIFSVKLDFYSLQLYGVRLLSESDGLASRIAYRNFYVASDTWQVLDKWLFGYLLNAPLPEKYHEKFQEVFSNNYHAMAISLSGIFGEKRALQICETVCKAGFSCLPKVGKLELLCILSRVVLKNPYFHIRNIPRFLYYQLKNRIILPGEFISVSGPDGCGKTTVLGLAMAQLELTFCCPAKKLHHFRPNILPRIASVLKMAGLVSSVDEEYSSPHRGSVSGFWGSLFRFLYYWIDYTCGYFLRIRPALVRRELVVFDRYYFDMIADPGRSRIALPLWMLKFGLKIIPLPKTSFFIHVSPEIVLQRKQELSLGKIQELNANYLKVVATTKLKCLDNNSVAEIAAASLVDKVIERRIKRFNLGRLLR